MNKQTKYNRKNKNNKHKKTRKYFGGSTEPINSNPTIKQLQNIDSNTNTNKTIEQLQDSGIIGLVADKLSEPLIDAYAYLSKQALKLVGLQPINNYEQPQPQDQESGIESGVNKMGSAIVGVITRFCVALIEQINEVLGSPQAETSVTEAAKRSLEHGEKLLRIFNTVLSTPAMKIETEKTVDQVVAYIKLSEPIIDQAVEELNRAGAHALSGVFSGLTKSLSDAAESIPVVGIPIGLFNVGNDITKASANTVEAIKDATSVVADAFDDFKNLYFDIQEGLTTHPNEQIQVQQGGKQLVDHMKAGSKILNRTNKSIDIFSDPLQYSNRKTKNKLLKYPTKTKKVRFLI